MTCSMYSYYLSEKYERQNRQQLESSSSTQARAGSVPDLVRPLPADLPRRDKANRPEVGSNKSRLIPFPYPRISLHMPRSKSSSQLYSSCTCSLCPPDPHFLQQLIHFGTFSDTLLLLPVFSLFSSTDSEHSPPPPFMGLILMTLLRGHPGDRD